MLPSMVTLANLFFGFLAMAKVADALRMNAPGASFSEVLPFFETAVVLVFIAMVCDALDGRVARMTGQTSNFGAQLDSLADMVTFGLVPAFIAKVLVDWHAQADQNMLLPVGPKLFYASAAVYVLGAAIEWQLAMVTLTLAYVVWGMLLGAYRLVFGRGRGPDDDLDVEVDADRTMPARPTPSRN